MRNQASSALSDILARTKDCSQVFCLHSCQNFLNIYCFIFINYSEYYLFAVFFLTRPIYLCMMKSQRNKKSRSDNQTSYFLIDIKLSSDWRYSPKGHIRTTLTAISRYKLIGSSWTIHIRLYDRSYFSLGSRERTRRDRTKCYEMRHVWGRQMIREKKRREQGSLYCNRWLLPERG